MRSHSRKDQKLFLVFSFDLYLGLNDLKNKYKLEIVLVSSQI